MMNLEFCYFLLLIFITTIYILRNFSFVKVRLQKIELLIPVLYI